MPFRRSHQARERHQIEVFTAFSISSTDIKMMITLRRVTTPIAPIVNRINAEK